MTRIYLASASPRRKELLQQLNLQFSVVPSNISEAQGFHLTPEQRAIELAKNKALNVSGSVDEGIVIAADTMVVHKDRIMDKPKDENEAKEMLACLSGDKHKVITGIALVNVNDEITLTDRGITDVWFRKLNPSEIDSYIKTGEPADKAGAYGIQGYGAIFVDKIDGCYYNVMGLPLAVFAKMLEVFGIRVLN